MEARQEARLKEHLGSRPEAPAENTDSQNQPKALSARRRAMSRLNASMVASIAGRIIRTRERKRVIFGGISSLRAMAARWSSFYLS
jgi:hypothetical protein